jgi:hypothetical protein
MHKCFDARQFFAPIIPDAARNYFTLSAAGARSKSYGATFFIALACRIVSTIDICVRESFGEQF